MHRSWIVPLAGLGLIASLWSSALLGAALSRGAFASQPRTYRAAVIAVLERHAIPYRDVQVRNACQPYPADCFEQSVLIMTATRSAVGTIVCRRYYEDCTLWLTTLGLSGVALPSLAQDPIWVRALRHRIWQIQYALHLTR